MSIAFERLLASLFVVIAHYTLWWALIVHGFGITPRSWWIVIICAVAQATVGVIAKMMTLDSRKT